MYDAAGDFLISGTCALPNATTGQPYQASLPTSHAAGGALRIVPPRPAGGLSLSATFAAPGGTISGGRDALESDLRPSPR